MGWWHDIVFIIHICPYQILALKRVTLNNHVHDLEHNDLEIKMGKRHLRSHVLLAHMIAGGSYSM